MDDVQFGRAQQRITRDVVLDGPFLPGGYYRATLQAAVLALEFGLVPPDRQPGVRKFVRTCLRIACEFIEDVMESSDDKRTVGRAVREQSPASPNRPTPGEHFCMAMAA